MTDNSSIGVSLKKQIALFALVSLSLGMLQLPSFADSDKWFSQYDHDHDGKWTYNDFRAAHMNYWKHHHDEKRWNNDEMQAHWKELNHDGYVTTDQVRTLHHWD